MGSGFAFIDIRTLMKDLRSTSSITYKMIGRIVYYSLCFLLLLGTICSADHSEDQTPDPKMKTRVKVGIPNFFNLMPNLGKLMDDFDKELLNSVSNPQTPLKGSESKESVPPNIHDVKDNYKTLREFVQSALNLGRRGLNAGGLFSLNLGNDGSNTKLDLNSLFGRISMNAKSENEKSETITEEPSTEVPLNEYLDNLVQEQSKGINDFVLSIFGPGNDKVVSVKRKDKETSVDVSVPEAPVQVSVDSRSGDIGSYDAAEEGTTSQINDQTTETDDATLDPELEYLRHAEQLHRKQLLLRGHDPVSRYLDGVPLRKKTNPIVDTLTSDFKRKSNQGASKRIDPVQKMTQYYYNLSTGKSKELPVENTYEEYIEDIEKITGTLKEDSRNKLRRALEQFRESIEKVDFGEDLDASQLIDEPEDEPAWISKRMIDQRDLEIAFLNIDKNDKPNPGDKMVLAFTPSGIPLKIFMDSAIENPVLYLQKTLSEAGVTLNVPVSSFRDMKTVGNEVLYVGAGNSGNFPTRAMSIIIPKAGNIPGYVQRFSKAAKIPFDDGRGVSKELSQALEEYLSSDKDEPFSDILAGSLKENPRKILADIINHVQKTSMRPPKPALEEFFDN